MSTIVTRAGKGTPLTHAEVDANFTNLNTDKLETSTAASTYAPKANPALTGTATVNGGTIITAADTGTVTSTMIANGTIVDADVNASAAIAGTKVSPSFGAQAVTTTGTSTAASFIPTSSTAPTNGVYLPAANSVAISTGGSGRLFVDASGRVGIGTTPSQKLHVAGADGSGNTVIGCYGGTTAGDYGLLTLGNGTTDKASMNVDATTNDLRIDLRGNSGAFKFVSGASYTERARIDSSGRLGIATASPSEILHIGGSSGQLIRVNGPAIAAYWGAADANTTQIAANRSPLTGTRVDGTRGASFINLTGTTSGGEISFATINSAADATERARIDSSGRLGINSTLSGNSNNQVLIRKNSNSAVVDALLLNNGNADNNAGTGVRINFSGVSEANSNLRYAYIESATTTTGNDHYIAFGTNAAAAAPLERVRVDSSGRLLVGTSSDSGGALFQVNGDRIRVGTAKTPASATATGTTGEICWDASYVYVCTATNTWKRSALATW